MKIDCLGSGSRGNCYIINDGISTLMIECGIRFRKIMEFLHYRTDAISGCLISHEHGDHCISVKDITARGIEVYASKGTSDELINRWGVDEDYIHPIHYNKATSKYEMIEIGSFIVYTFDTIHDTSEPTGYLIYSRETKEKLLFLTDSNYCDYIFNGVDTIMIEANHDVELVHDNITNGVIDYTRGVRTLNTHMSIDTCCNYLSKCDLKSLKRVLLLHLSGDNSKPEEFRKKAESITGLPVEICKVGTSFYQGPVDIY